MWPVVSVVFSTTKYNLFSTNNDLFCNDPLLKKAFTLLYIYITASDAQSTTMKSRKYRATTKHELHSIKHVNAEGIS